jgi:hypothetical protein
MRAVLIIFVRADSWFFSKLPNILEQERNFYDSSNGLFCFGVELVAFFVGLSPDAPK